MSSLSIQIKRAALLAILLFLIACSPSPPPVAQTTSSPSPFAPSLQTATEAATATNRPATETAAAAPRSEPPASFQSEVLRGGIEPVSYITDSCTYIQMRWDPANSTPGTVVAPVMFHSILQGSTTPTLAQDINFNTFKAIVALAKELGFETITSDELLRFLTENAKIPPRSMILILDDRRPGTAEDYFLSVNEENNWTTTLAWPIGNTDSRPGKLSEESLWDWIERLNETDYFDIQSHGLNHIYLNEDMSEDTIREEVSGSISILKQHFGHRPIAYIWPGGNYTALGVQVAEEAGFQLGFTVHSRGPLQFNWIPQGEQERAIGSPLLLLPRFWDTAALLNLEQTAEIGDAAREFARQNYAAEAAWFSQNCGGQLPPLEDVLK